MLTGGTGPAAEPTSRVSAATGEAGDTRGAQPVGDHEAEGDGAEESVNALGDLLEKDLDKEE